MKKIELLLKISGLVVSLGCVAYFGCSVADRWDEVTSAFGCLWGEKWRLALAVALMPVVLVMETIRWSVLRRGVIKGAIRQDVEATLSAVALGNATPGNLGEHFGRVLSYSAKTRAALMSLCASMLMTAAITILGLTGAAVLTAEEYDLPWTSVAVAIGTIIVGLVIVGFFILVRLKPDKIKWIPEWWRVSVNAMCGAWRNVVASLALSVVKALVFSFQLFMLLRTCGDSLPYSTVPVHVLFAAVLLYYLCITVTPRVNLIDVGVKGAWSLCVLGALADEGIIVASTVVMWVVNIVTMSLLGAVAMAAKRILKALRGR